MELTVPLVVVAILAGWLLSVLLGGFFGLILGAGAAATGGGMQLK